MKALTKKLKLLGALFAIILLLFVLIFSLASKRRSHQIVLGVKNDTELHVVGEIIAQLIEKKTDLRVVRRFNLDGTVICFNALFSGTVDLSLEYTGTALLHVLKQSLPKEDLYPIVKEAYEKHYNLIWFDSIGFSNQYVLVARSDSEMKRFSDIGPKTVVAYDPEFSVREEADLLKEAYAHISYSKLMEQVILYFSLLNGSTDVISSWVTAGQLVDPRFKILEDDAHVFPRYDLAPVVRKTTLEKYPELGPILSLVAESFSEEEIRQMNHQVEFEGKNIVHIASYYINEKFNM